MISLETTAKVRRDHFVHGKSIKQISRERGISRNSVRKILRSGDTTFQYERPETPMPKLGAFLERLEAMLEANEKRAKRDRFRLTRIFDDLRREGYEGGYDAVRRHAQRWRRRRHGGVSQAYVPLTFAPGEAFQFDWSHEWVVMGGVTTKVKVAHIRLCYSRMRFLVAYPRETQEMVFDVHDRAFAFFGGACARGMPAQGIDAIGEVCLGGPGEVLESGRQAVGPVFLWHPAQGPQRVLDPFGQGHVALAAEDDMRVLEAGVGQPEMIEPVIEGLAGDGHTELAHVGEIRQAHLARNVHLPEHHLPLGAMLGAPRPYPPLQGAPRAGRQIGMAALEFLPDRHGAYAETTAAVSKTCLVSFDRNRYSVSAEAVARSRSAA
jgi:hypothetical protein